MLTPEDLADLASADPNTSPRELAERLGKPYQPVADALLRMRLRGGWYCDIDPAPCRACGYALGHRGRRVIHPICKRERRILKTLAARPVALRNVRRDWTRNEDRLIMESPQSHKELAALLGRSPGAVRQRRQSLIR